MFQSAPIFNQNIGSWNLSKANNMTYMFFFASAFNNGGSTSIGNWTAPLCTSFSGMFQSATSFNQPLTNLVNTSGLTTGCILSNMFRSAPAFNQNIGGWKVNNAILMENMFQSATAFNNGGSTSIQNWSAPLCTSFGFMFNNCPFNQPVTNLVNTTTVASCSLIQMFRQASSFNQNIGSWNVSKVTDMTLMFSQATAFNNGGSTDIQNWTAPLCTTFASMFYLCPNFNQPVTNLVNTSGLTTGCTLASMFRQATAFNNGQSGKAAILNVLPTTSFYTNSTKILKCPGATFNTSLNVGDVLIIETATPFVIYSSAVQTKNNDEEVTLVTAYGSNLSVGTITSITKQVAGTAPLNWNTVNVNNLNFTFNLAPFFNQKISTDGNIWNTQKVLDISSLFAGTTAQVNLFNNGQIITGTTEPMGWTFNAVPTGGTTSAYRTNCRLTSNNRPASLP